MTSQLRQCQNVEDLAKALGTSYKKISYFYYTSDYSKHSYYEKFEVAKKSGGVRVINAPIAQLKNLQRKLASLLDDVFEPHSCAHGFVSEKSIVTNSKNHTRKKYVFNIDLDNFFHTITFARVFGLLTSKPYSLNGKVASVIAHLCTLNGCLPQGAPTSPVISNMICRQLDRQLSKLARENRASYSRYADDITFSFYDPDTFVSDSIVAFKEGAGNYFADTGAVLRRIISANRFSVNEAKTRLQDRFERQVVTGLVVNKKVNVPREFVRKTCAMIHSIEVFGLQAAQDRFLKENPNSLSKIENVVYGRILHLKNVIGFDSMVYRRVALRYNHLNVSRKAPLSSEKHGSVAGSYSKWANQRCWVVESDEDISQGSGFMISGGLLITCAHVVRLAGKGGEVDVYRVFENKMYKAVVCYLSSNDDVDVAILKIKNAPVLFEEFHFNSEAFVLGVGQQLTVLGFPQLKTRAESVLINNVVLLGEANNGSGRVGYLDKELYSGNSGGPVLNQSSELIGMAIKGNKIVMEIDDIYTDHSAFLNFSSVLECVEKLKAEYDI